MVDGIKPALGGRGVVGFGADGQPFLVGGHCQACGARAFPQGAVCAGCMSEDIEPERLPNEGNLYSYTLLHVGDPKWDRPIAIGFVDLPNGLRVFARLKPGEQGLRMDQAVRLDYGRVGQDADGNPIETFLFTPDK